MITSKSHRRVLQVAYDAACEALPAHRHRFSPREFTRHQLLACLVLQESLRLDYRGLEAHPGAHLDLRRQIGPGVVPHYTTFHEAAARLLAAVAGRRRFDAVLERAARDRVRRRRVRMRPAEATLDSSYGLEADSADPILHANGGTDSMILDRRLSKLAS